MSQTKNSNSPNCQFILLTMMKYLAHRHSEAKEELVHYISYITDNDEISSS